MAERSDLHFFSPSRDCAVLRAEGCRSVMADFHEHDHYEISLILSGDVRVLFSDRMQEGTESRVVLSAPHVPHFMSLRTQSFYRRANLIFTDDFVADYVPEWGQLRTLFGANGSVIVLSEEQARLCDDALQAIEQETNLFRKRLLLLLFLSRLSEFAEPSARDGRPVPTHIAEAMRYVGEHYTEKLIAADLASRFAVGRTTLLTDFKRTTGTTLGEYIARCRVRHATHLLRRGLSEEEVAHQTGFGDACNLIRTFKRCYGTTPKKYINQADGRKEPTHV